MSSSPPEPPALPPPVRRALATIGALVFCLMLGLAAALGHSQLGGGDEARAGEKRQTLRQVMLPAPRGVIYDRHHRVLAGHRHHTAAVLHLGRLREEFLRASELSASLATPEQTRWSVVQQQLERVETILGRAAGVDPAAFAAHYLRERTRPFVLIEDLSPDEIARLSAALDPDEPVQVEELVTRWYPEGSSAAHVLGRVRRTTVQTPVGAEFPILNYTDLVGDWGLEKLHDDRLTGEPGHRIVRVDALGLPVGPPLAFQEPVPGGDIVLSLDLDLQRAAEQAMAAVPGQPRGAAVALAIATGEILALVSKPDYDLNAVSPVLSRAAHREIEAAGGWLNRATQGLYPPGSSFKIFTTIAGLRGNTLQPETLFECAGYHEVAGHRFPCHNPEGHGSVSLTTGLARSCNVYAYQAGLTAGPEALAAEARRFHFDRPTGLDLPSETSRMLVPDPAWKLATDGSDWTLGDTANLTIGQGFLRYTPLQAACAMASLARRETLTVPTLLRQPGRAPSGELPSEPLGLSDADYAALLKALRAVVETGIGRSAQVPGVSIAGKTGTAQVARPEGMQNIAWFLAFAPAERPEIAVAVALEGNTPNVEFAGAEHAAPVVREIIGAFFDQHATIRRP